MKINPYLNFNGQCEAAFKFYQTCLGGNIPMMLTYEGSPMSENTTPEMLKKIMHTRLVIGDMTIMGSDSPAGCYEAPKGFHVTLNFDKPEEAERIYNLLSEKGTAHMPIQETFWAKRFAMFVDQFGVPWMINCEKTA